jgi:hypothetical protein
MLVRLSSTARRPRAFQLPEGTVEEAVGRQLDGRDVAQGQQPALLEGREIPSQAVRDPAKLVRGLLQREKDAGFAVAGPLQEELQAQEGLSRPRPALDDGRAGAGQPASEHGVETGHPGRDTLRSGDRRPAAPADSAAMLSGFRTRGKNVSPSGPIS